MPQMNEFSWMNIFFIVFFMMISMLISFYILHLDKKYFSNINFTFFSFFI